MNTVIIAFGSNLGHSADTVRLAAFTLAEHPHIRNLTLSPLYRSAPVGYTNQPDFVNAVALVETVFTAPGLLRHLQSIEQDFGRRRSFPNAPRTLDLDIIDFNHEIHNTDTLTLPHPRAHQRSFVMRPLADLAPDYRLGGQHKTAAELADTLGSDGLDRLTPL